MYQLNSLSLPPPAAVPPRVQPRLQDVEHLEHLQAGNDDIHGGNGIVQALDQLDPKHIQPEVPRSVDKPHGNVVVLVEIWQRQLLELKQSC